MIWKARCGRVFNNLEPDFIKIGHQAIEPVEVKHRKLKDEIWKLSFFPFHSQLSLFTEAAWLNRTKCCGLGFALVNSNKGVILAFITNSFADSSTQAEAKAMEIALQCCLDRELIPSQVYTNSTSHVEAVFYDD